MVALVQQVVMVLLVVLVEVRLEAQHKLAGQGHQDKGLMVAQVLIQALMVRVEVVALGLLALLEELYLVVMAVLELYLL
jgi:hypothetical protein